MRISALGLLFMSSLAQGAGAQDVDAVPPHPRALRFLDKEVKLPSAEGHRFELQSGPVVYLEVDRTLPLVEISLALRVGSFLEQEFQTGLAYLVGSQVRRAGSQELAADHFDERADHLGARIDSTAGVTRSGVSLSVPTWSLEGAFELFFAMLKSPAFSADRLDAARSNLIESMSRRNEDALDVLEREWDWLMHGPSHFSTRPMTPSTLMAFSRQEMLRFHTLYWRPEAMVIAVSGDFVEADILDTLNRGFADWPVPSEPLPTVPWPPPAPGESVPIGLYHYEADVPQAKVVIGRRLPHLPDWSDRNRFILEVLAEILGGRGAISRLSGRLRTAEALVYRAAARLDAGSLWPGQWQIFFETQNTFVPRATEMVIEELLRLSSANVHEKELEIAKRSMLARLRLDFDTAEERVGYFAEDEILGRPHDYWQTYFEQVQTVSAAEVRRAAGEQLDPSLMTYLVVGRWSEIADSDHTGRTALEQAVERDVIQLPTRNPVTLQPLATGSDQGGPIDENRSDG